MPLSGREAMVVSIFDKAWRFEVFLSSAENGGSSIMAPPTLRNLRIRMRTCAFKDLAGYLLYLMTAHE